MRVEALDPARIGETNEHLARHVHESGRFGVHWLPYDPQTMPSPPSVNESGLHRDFDEVGWERWYVVINKSDQIVGHLSLTGGRFDRGLHRCELGMGLEHPYWRRGLGTELLTEAIAYARQIPTVDWLDLRVIGINTPGLHLYRRMGFTEISRVPDFCRIDGAPVDDVFMSIRVDKAASDGDRPGSGSDS